MRTCVTVRESSPAGLRDFLIRRKKCLNAGAPPLPAAGVQTPSGSGSSLQRVRSEQRGRGSRRLISRLAGARPAGRRARSSRRHPVRTSSFRSAAVSRAPFGEAGTRGVRLANSPVVGRMTVVRVDARAVWQDAMGPTRMERGEVELRGDHPLARVERDPVRDPVVGLDAIDSHPVEGLDRRT